MTRKTDDLSRRVFLGRLLLAGPAWWTWQAVASGQGDDWERAIADLERKHGGRRGAAVLDTAGTEMRAHRGNERFPLCSTFKLLAAAFVLARVDRREESLDRRITYGKDQLVPYSPVTEKHADDSGGLSVGELCEAAVTRSDNTAGNLLLDSFGGPAALTNYLRSLEDAITRLDRREPELNGGEPDDPRDTTTPVAMLETVRRTVLGDALAEPSREQLAAWLVANQTGDKRLRAGLPRGWRVGDKTGTGGEPRRATNDVAVVWPTGRAPMIVTAFYIDSPAPDDERSDVLAEVGRSAAAW